MALQLVITNAGRAAVIDQANGGFRAVRIASVGVSPVAVAAAPAATALPGEVTRIASVAGEATAADVVHLTVTDESAASYSVRSFALYLSDGTLFALYGQLDPIVEKSAQALMLLALDVTLVAVPAAAITFGSTNFSNPAATTERAGVVELATPLEAINGTDDRRAVTPAAARAAVVDWIGYPPANRDGDTFVGLVTIRSGTYGLRISHPSVPGYGYIQFGEDANPVRNWHVGTPADGSFRLFQGNWGTGTERLAVSSASISFNSNVIWHAGNDGAGSGLDADLLDGLQGSRFMRVDVPVTVYPNVAYDLPNSTWGKSLRLGGDGYTAAGLLGSLIVTDGTMHLDAAERDIFLNYYGGLGVSFGNGRQGIVARVSEAGVFTGTGVNAPAIRRAGLNLWGPDNDGAGSGLDADLLDGLEGSRFMRVDVPVTVYPNVAYDLPNSTWGKSLRLGGNGYTAGGKLGSLIVTDGTLHLDAAERDIFLNYYGGLGVSFGNGRQSIVARVSEAGFFTGTGIDALVARRGGLNLWGPDNDGAGSGLDADLLDGLEGSRFMRVDVPVTVYPNVAYDLPNSTWGKSLRIGGNGYTAGGLLGSLVVTDGTLHLDAAERDIFLNYYGGLGVSFGNGRQGIVARVDEAGFFSGTGVGAPVMRRVGLNLWGPDNDGAGSGLDADLLDGRDGGWYLPAAGYTAADVLAKAVTVDGAGSGLDADLLDGWHRDEIRDWNSLLNRPAAFPPTAHTHGAADLAGAFPGSLSGNGYTVLPNGLILQWITGAVQGAGSEGAQSVTFPIAFPNACFQVFVTTQVGNVNIESHATYQLVSHSTDAATVMRQLVSSAGSDREPSWPRLFAIGR